MGFDEVLTEQLNKVYMGNIELKAGDIVRYPTGLFKLNVRKVYEDKNGDLYVKECINTIHEYKRYIYRSMDGYNWDTRLCKEFGFNIAKEDEMEFLED